MILATVDAGFIAPNVLVGIVAVVVVGAALLLRDAAFDRMALRVIGPRRYELGGARPRPARLLRAVLFVAGSALALVALARPTWGRERTLVTATSVDCVVALDVSRSMLARDVLPSRLERAKTLLRGLAGRITSDRIGLVVFAGDARLLVPLTQDMESFAELLDEATPDATHRGGTDLGAALSTALEALPDAASLETAARVIVLISDGEDLSGAGMSAAKMCAERGVTVHAIGLGTVLGGKIPLWSEPSRRAGQAFLADRDGRDVISVFDARSLRAIADATGGSYVDGNADADALLGMIDERVLRAAKSRVDAQERGERRIVYQWPLLAAWLLWLLELAWTDRRIR